MEGRILQSVAESVERNIRRPCLRAQRSVHDGVVAGFGVLDQSEAVAEGVGQFGDAPVEVGYVDVDRELNHERW
ncbi:hypothetical protein [Elongatibacter sediminis]|uniref:hypothetical protein n=1 Tax=Elongatibacter sediminis TaxID=3119006 RepID=UPI00339D56B9